MPKRKKTFENKFIDYEEKGNSVELLGKEDLDGTECYVIKMIEKNGHESKSYFDVETHLLIMESTIIEDGPSAGSEVRNYYSEYTEMEGLLFYFGIESKMEGQTMMIMTIESIEINLEIDDSKFQMPQD